jgi:hypothetical protein
MRNLETRNPGEESRSRVFLNLLNSSPNESGKQARNAAEEKNQMNQESRKRGKEEKRFQTSRLRGRAFNCGKQSSLQIFPAVLIHTYFLASWFPN